MSPVLIHSTAVVHPRAGLGEGTEIGPYAVIEDEVIIGNRCRIHAGAVIKRYTRMGDDNQVFEGAVLGGVPQDMKFRGERTYLSIGSDNVFREGVTLHRATEAELETVVGNHNYLMALSHVAHNCRLGDHVIIANNVALAGHIEIGDRAFLSGGVVVHQFCRIGGLSMIGGNSKVTQDVLPFALVDGVPAVVRGLNLVGLRRAGFSSARLRDLKEGYRILFLPGGSLQRKIADLSGSPSEDLRSIAAFIQKSGRGFCRRARLETE